jgi:protein O-mannosyl-transferase
LTGDTKRNTVKKKARTIAASRSAFSERLSTQVSILLSLVFVAYWNSLRGGFHFDDQGIFLDPYIVSSGFGFDLFRWMQTRPLTYLTFHWNYLLDGAVPLGYHIVSLLLHGANTVLVLLVARLKLTPHPALLAGALFAIHPLQTQAVNYVFERATLLATFFALLSLLSFLRERLVASVVWFGLSLLAKEETIALPVLLLVYDLARRRRLVWKYYGAMFAVAAAVAFRLGYVLQVTGEKGLGFGTKGISPIAYALTQCRVIWGYLRLFVFPSGLTLEHDVTLSQSLLSPPANFWAVLSLLLFAGALMWLAGRKSEPALWALGFFVLILPSSSVVPVRDVMFEHRTYFPLVCLALAVACLVARFNPATWRLPAAAVLAALLLTTIVRNRAWFDESTLWADVIEKSPGVARGYFQLGQTYASKDPVRARQLYERGLEIDPESGPGHTNLGLLLLAQGDLDNAMNQLRQALAVGGDAPLVWNNIGAVYLRRGELEEGIKCFLQALERNPCRFDARVNLARALAASNRKEEAVHATLIPEDCRMLPEQVRRLEQERDSIR